MTNQFQPESYDFIYHLRKVMDDYTNETELLLMTEAYSTIQQQVLWHGRDMENPGAQMPFNFLMISDLDWESTANDFKATIESYLDAKPFWAEPNFVLGNHDQPRVGSRFGVERHESMSIIALMLPGPHVIYYVSWFCIIDNRNFMSIFRARKF